MEMWLENEKLLFINLVKRIDFFSSGTKPLFCYWLELNTYASDSRAYYRNRWQNAVNTVGDWYLKLGLGVDG